MQQAALAIMAILGFTLPGCVRSPIYFPTSTPAQVIRQLEEAYDARRDAFEVEPGVTLMGLRHDGGDDAPMLVFFGGNAMSIVESASVLAQVTTGRDWGWAVWAYRGYDGSDGSPRQDKLFADALAQVRHLGVPPRRLIAIGQSLGTGIAMHLTAELARRGEAPAGAVVLSPYTSIKRVAEEAIGLPIGWLLADRYETELELPAVASPVLVIHGVQDDIIAIAHGREVAAALGNRATLVEIPEAGHNDLWTAPLVPDAIRRFIEARIGSTGAGGDGGDSRR